MEVSQGQPNLVQAPNQTQPTPEVDPKLGQGIPPVEAQKDEPVKEDKFSSKFAALSKREKQLLDREKKLKERESKYVDYDKFDQELDQNPVTVLEKRMGKDWYNKLTQYVLNDGKPTESISIQKVQAELEKMRQEQLEEKERIKRETEEQEQSKKKAEYEGTIEGFRNEIKDFITKDSATYELTHAHPEAVDVVYNVIEQHYQATERVLTVKEAVEHVEKYFEEEAEKLLSLQKVKAKAGQAPKDPKTPPAQVPGSHSSKTLTNSQQTDVPSPSNKPMSVEESKEMAKKLLRWT